MPLHSFWQPVGKEAISSRSCSLGSPWVWQGIYYFQEPEEVKVEEKFPELIEEFPEISPEAVPQETAGEERAGEAFRMEEEARRIDEAVEIPPAVAPEKIRIEIPPPPKKEKPTKKKKVKLEGEKAPRLRKSEKRFIEEKIEIEESEQEALSALKEEEEKEEGEVIVEVAEKKEKKKEVQAIEAEKEEIAPPPAPGEPSFGFFAEKLKSALTKKGKEEDKKK